MNIDIKEYIQSGILELYAAGALSGDEAKEVESMASQYSEVKIELNTIAEAYAKYGSLYKRNPRPGLRGEIIESIESSESSPAFKANVIDLSTSKPELVERRYARLRYFMAAVIAFLVLNVTSNFFVYYKWRNTEKGMREMANENAKMKQDYETMKTSLDKKTDEMKMLMSRTNKVVDLKGMGMSPKSFATVYWNPNSKHVMLNVESLPMPSDGKQYELWAIKGGKPVDAGVFDMGGDSMHSMSAQISEADEFAITLENKGGSKTPTMTQMYVMGKI